jgi:peptidoglycan-associated lipoprotein
MAKHKKGSLPGTSGLIAPDGRRINKEDCMKNILVVMVLALVIIVAGCASKKTVKSDELPLQPEVQQKPSVTTQETEQKSTAFTLPSEKITDQQLAKFETKDETVVYSEEKSTFDDIYFDYDEYTIREEAEATLKSISSWLLKNTSASLLIEGHCDERGTNEYNLALADRRAKAARDYLVALGIDSRRLEMVSYGEEMPLCTEQTEECWAKNRRDHFVILKEVKR